MQKTKKQTRPTNPLCFNQTIERYNKRLSYERGSQVFKNIICGNKILMGFSHQINRSTPTLVFITFTSHRWLILIVNYGFIMWFNCLVLCLTDTDKLTTP